MRLWPIVLAISALAHAADFVPIKVDPGHHAIRAVVRDHDQWVAAGGGSTAALFRSADGEHWSRIEVSRAAGPLRALVGDGHGDLLAVGGAKAASGVTSPDDAETALPIAFEKTAPLEAMVRRQDT